MKLSYRLLHSAPINGTAIHILRQIRYSISEYRKQLTIFYKPKILYNSIRDSIAIHFDEILKIQIGCYRIVIAIRAFNLLYWTHTHTHNYCSQLFLDQATNIQIPRVLFFLSLFSVSFNMCQITISINVKTLIYVHKINQRELIIHQRLSTLLELFFSISYDKTNHFYENVFYFFCKSVDDENWTFIAHCKLNRNTHDYVH